MQFVFKIHRTLSAPFELPLGVDRFHFVKMYLGVLARYLKLKLGFYDILTQLANKYSSDKGVTIYPFHSYTLQYSNLLKDIRHQKLSILEIGLARKRDRGKLKSPCPSLNMWADYFPNASIYGLDIDDFSDIELPRTKIYRGDQGSTDDLEIIVADCGKFDIIIDDGSHASFHQQTSLKTLYPHLVTGGIYIIEDLHYQSPELEKSLPSTIKTKELLQNQKALEEMISGIESISVYSSTLGESTKNIDLGILIKN